MASAPPNLPLETSIQKKQDKTVTSIKVEGSDSKSIPTTQDDVAFPFGEAVETIMIPRGCESTFIRRSFKNNITILAVQSKRMKKVPPNTDENLRRFRDARVHLAWLYTNLQMTPKIRDSTPIEKLLDLIVGDTLIHFPGDIVYKAAALKAKWDDENWGVDEVIDIKEEDNEDDEDANIQQGSSDAAGEILTQQIARPAHDDPMFGTNGLMTGVLTARSANKGVKIYVLNPDVQKPSARVFGHNSLTVGDWFPLQISTLARGAHGSRMGGIYGNLSEGAYSIVASQMYHELDRDEGEILYYSGSASHSNENPLAPAPSSSGTKALIVSMASRRPVRVLRSGGALGSKNSSPFAPSCGIRYDGLYEIVKKLTPKNARGKRSV